MLTQKQVKEIREHLNNSQNPLFLFDNDADGLCSFLLLQRFLGRGKGIPVKSYPSMNKDYLRRAKELNADYIFILDKPLVEEDFFEEAAKINIPIVWIDHHETQNKIPDFVHYYNPLFNKEKSNEPVTNLCYQISGRKEDLWIEIIGCISDKFLPGDYFIFKKKFPELAADSSKPFDIFYKSEIGKITKILGFALKDRITNVVKMLKFLIKAKSPYDILNEKTENHTIHKRFSEIDKKYSRLLEKAKKIAENSKKILFFQYGGDLSISSELSNELSYVFPDKIIIVVRINGATASFSARGKKVRDIILKCIENIPNSRGGGHEDAVGGQMKTENIENFKKKIFEIV